MRLLHLDAQVFGALRGKSFDVDPRIAVVFGANEAGKSTFLSALETLIFGFDPSTRSAHPLAQWSQGTAVHADLHLEANIAFEEDTAVRVERVLLSRGALRIAPAGEPFTGKRESNRPLSEVHGVSRELFRAVYALHSSDLVELTDDVRDAVDQLLLGERSIAGMRPTYRVRAELLEEASALWREDNRGKPKSSELKRSMRDARKAVQAAREEESALRDALEEKRGLEHDLEELREKKRALEREESEAAYLKALFELAARRTAARPVDLSALAGMPLVDPDGLAGEVLALERKLAEPRARLAREPLAQSRFETAVFARASEIETLLASRGRHEAERESFAETRERAQALEREVAAGFARLTGRTPNAEDFDALRTFPLTGLRAAHETWTHAWEEAPAGQREVHGTRGALAWIFILGGLGVTFVGGVSFGALHALFGVLGAALLLAAIVLAGRRPAPRADATAPGRDTDVDRFLARLDFEPALLATPSSVLRLVDNVEAVLGVLADLDGVRERERADGRALQAREAGWSRLALELDLAGPDGESGGSDADLLRLEDALARARERREEVKVDAAERARAQTLVDAYAPDLERLRTHLDRLSAALAANSTETEDPARSFALVSNRLEEERYLTSRTAELRKDPRWKALANDSRLAPENAMAAPWLAVSGLARSDELAALEKALAVKHRRVGELAERLRADEGSGVARAQERLLALESELHEAAVERDRLVLMEHLLGEADRVHREEHQPDVLRRASRYLESITGGRYSQLDYPEETGGGLLVTCRGKAEPLLVAPPISRGTRDQIYLCLRLGLLDHLDEGKTPLPLVLDEALVHWDEGRRLELYPLLREVAGKRQVFLLTCHAAIAGEAEEALETQRVDLGAIVPRQESLRFE